MSVPDSGRPTLHTMSYTNPTDQVDEGWPWDCADCGATVYHEGKVCSDCAREARADAGTDAARIRIRSLPRILAGVCTAVLLVLL